MTRCTRCCLHKALRIVNVILNLCGIGMIIYSLWLEKKWDDGVSDLGSTTNLPRPWFIYTCIGVGIAVCLSTLIGHMIANCISNSTLCIYIVSVCSLVFIQVVVIVAILFKMGLESALKNIDAEEFSSFMIFHLNMCRLIVIMVVVVQIGVVVLGGILWAIGTEPSRHNHSSDPPDFTHSFLVEPNSSLPDFLKETSAKFEGVDGEDQRESFLSYIKSIFRWQFWRRTRQL